MAKLKAAVPQAVELAGFAAIVYGVDRIASRGVAAIVLGLLLVLVAYGVDRR